MLFLYPSRFRGCAEFEFPCHYSKKKNQSSDLLINRLMPFRLLHQLTQRIIEIVPLKKKKNEIILHVNARCRHFYTTRNSIAFRLARLAPTTSGLILSNLQSHFRRTQEFFSAQEKVPFAFTAGRPFTYIYIGKNPRCCLILLGEWGDEKEKCVHRRVCTSRAGPFL